MSIQILILSKITGGREEALFWILVGNNVISDKFIFKDGKNDISDTSMDLKFGV